MQHLNVFVPVLLVGSFYLVHIIYSRKQAAAREKKNACHLLQSQIDMQEQTFQKISAEIHDNIALTLSLSKIYLHDLDFNNQGDVMDKVNMSVCLIRKAMNDLSNLSKTLTDDSIAKFGLAKSVENLVDDIRKADLFKITIHVKGTQFSRSVNDELIIYRILQEALNNVIRHAKATEVSISMQFEMSNWKMIITDNGIGFELAELHYSNGHGLKNLKKRAQILNASLLIDSAPQSGTTIKLIIPLNNNQLS